MSTTFESAALVAQTPAGEMRLLPLGTLLVADVQDGVLVLLKTERPRLVALSILDKTAFAAVWHLINKWPAAVGYAEMLALFGGKSAESEQDVIDAAVKSALTDSLSGEFQHEVAVVSEQLAVFGLEIVEVPEFGFKIGKREQHI